MDNKEIKEIIESSWANREFDDFMSRFEFRQMQDKLKSLQSNSVTDDEIDEAIEEERIDCNSDEANKIEDLIGEGFKKGAVWMRSKLTQETPTDEQEEKELSVEEFLKSKYIMEDIILNKEDLPEYRIRLSALLTDYKKQLK